MATQKLPVMSTRSNIDVRNFFVLPVEARNSSPSTWWVRQGKNRFPLMSKLAFKCPSGNISALREGIFICMQGYFHEEKQNQ